MFVRVLCGRKNCFLVPRKRGAVVAEGVLKIIGEFSRIEESPECLDYLVLLGIGLLYSCNECIKCTSEMYFYSGQF